MASSSLGQRSQVNPPTNQLNGGQRVDNDTTTYNFGVAQDVPWGGGNFLLNFNNSRLATNEPVRQLQPELHLDAHRHLQPAAAARLPHRRHAAADRRHPGQPRDRRGSAAVDHRGTIANVRNAYWDLAYARAAVDVAQRSLELAEKLVEDNQARVEVGTLAPIDIVQAEAEAATRRQTLAQAEATLATAQLALKRYIVSGTSDPLWTAGAARRRPARSSNRRRSTSKARSAARSSGAPTSRRPRKNLDSNDITLRYWRNQSRPALDLQVNYGAQGIGGTQFIREGTGIGSSVTGTVPGGYIDALALLSARDFPNWNAALTFSYPIGGSTADAQHARARVLRNQQSTRLRALELQVATEVTNAALQVQSQPAAASTPPGRRASWPSGGSRPSRASSRSACRPTSSSSRRSATWPTPRTSNCARSPTCRSRW